MRSLPSSRSQFPFGRAIADIEFDSNGQMVLAERGMTNNTEPNAHSARVHEYAFNAGLNQWVATGNSFLIGDTTAGLVPSAAGGVAYASCSDVWVTGDALHFRGNDLVYGLQNLPPWGGDNTTSYLIDLDGVDNPTRKDTDRGRGSAMHDRVLWIEIRRQRPRRVA